MSDNEAMVVMASLLFSAITAISLMVLWTRRGRHKPVDTEHLADRLLRIEQTLDSVAIEVERISEAQRFATKLLADREHLPAIAEPLGVRDGR
jgi:hypothetical protein